MKILVAIGDSHTNGSQIDGQHGSSEYNLRNGFPAMIAKEYGYELHNVSKPGGSNQYIHRSTIHYINNYMHPENEYFFLIGWSSCNRIELRYPDNTPWLHHTKGDFTDLKNIPFTPGTDPILWKSTQLKLLQNYTTFLFANDDIMYAKWAGYALGLQHYLKAKGLPFYMHNTCERLPLNPATNGIVSHIDPDYYLQPSEMEWVYIVYLENLGYQKSECWHFREDGHRVWADILIDKVKDYVIQ